jgi:hypothetical protein
VCVGALGAQVLARVSLVRYLNTGIIALSDNQTAEFFVTLDDTRGGAPANVLMQFLDDQGVAVARREVVLRPGQSASLETSGPGFVRGHAELMETTSLFTQRRAVVGSATVLNLTTRERDPSCSVDESGSRDAGRQ